MWERKHSTLSCGGERFSKFAFDVEILVKATVAKVRVCSQSSGKQRGREDWLGLGCFEQRNVDSNFRLMLDLINKFLSFTSNDIIAWSDFKLKRVWCRVLEFAKLRLRCDVPRAWVTRASFKNEKIAMRKWEELSIVYGK